MEPQPPQVNHDARPISFVTQIIHDNRAIVHVCILPVDDYGGKVISTSPVSRQSQSLSPFLYIS